jgi:hypothetical protein
MTQASLTPLLVHNSFVKKSTGTLQTGFTNTTNITPFPVDMSNQYQFSSVETIVFEVIGAVSSLIALAFAALQLRQMYRVQAPRPDDHELGAWDQSKDILFFVRHQIFITPATITVKTVLSHTSPIGNGEDITTKYATTQATATYLSDGIATNKSMTESTERDE